MMERPAVFVDIAAPCWNEWPEQVPLTSSWVKSLYRFWTRYFLLKALVPYSRDHVNKGTCGIQLRLRPGRWYMATARHVISPELASMIVMSFLKGLVLEFGRMRGKLSVWNWMDLHVRLHHRNTVWLLAS